jgi:hypothetical protein
MVGRKGWHGSIGRISMLAGSISAAVLVLGATAGVSDTAQASAVQRIGTPASEIGRQIKPIAHAIANTATIRTIRQIREFQAAHPSLGLHQPMLRPLIPMGQKAYEAAKRQAALAVGSKGPPPPQIYAAPATQIMRAIGPAETDSGNSFYPPDSNGAVGWNQMVAPVNLTYNVYNRVGAAQLNTTFNALLGTSNGLSDPRVIYDPLWKRWVVTLIDVTASASDNTCFWIAITTGINAKGPFIVYHPCISGGAFTGGLWDYDMQGMSQDAVIITGNLFGPAPGFGNYYGAVLVSIPKAKLYNGQPFSVPVASTPTTVGVLTPPIIQDSNANAYFLGSDSDGTHLDLYRGSNLSNEHQFSFALQAQISDTHAVPPAGRQPGTSQVLDTLDGRFQAPSAQYGNSLWNVHTVALGSFPSPKFYQIDTAGNSLTQAGYFYESGTSDDFNPSIAVNSNGDALVTWTATDAVGSHPHNARMRYSGQQSGDTLNTMPPGSLLYNSFVPLTGNFQNGRQRWGDYSSVFLDSSAPGGCTRAAIFNELIKDTNNWQVGMGIVGFC